MSNLWIRALISLLIFSAVASANDLFSIGNANVTFFSPDDVFVLRVKDTKNSSGLSPSCVFDSELVSICAQTSTVPDAPNMTAKAPCFYSNLVQPYVSLSWAPLAWWFVVRVNETTLMRRGLSWPIVVPLAFSAQNLLIIKSDAWESPPFDLMPGESQTFATEYPVQIVKSDILKSGQGRLLVRFFSPYNLDGGSSFPFTGFSGSYCDEDSSSDQLRGEGRLGTCYAYSITAAPPGPTVIRMTIQDENDASAIAVQKQIKFSPFNVTGHVSASDDGTLRIPINNLSIPNLERLVFDHSSSVIGMLCSVHLNDTSPPISCKDPRVRVLFIKSDGFLSQYGSLYLPYICKEGGDMEITLWNFNLTVNEDSYVKFSPQTAITPLVAEGEMILPYVTEPEVAFPEVYQFSGGDDFRGLFVFESNVPSSSMSVLIANTLGSTDSAVSTSWHSIRPVHMSFSCPKNATIFVQFQWTDSAPPPPVVNATFRVPSLLAVHVRPNSVFTTQSDQLVDLVADSIDDFTYVSFSGGGARSASALWCLAEGGEPGWNLPYAANPVNFIANNFSSLLYPFADDENGPMTIEFRFAPSTLLTLQEGKNVVNVAVARGEGTIAITNVKPATYVSIFASIANPPTTTWTLDTPRFGSKPTFPFFTRDIDPNAESNYRLYFLLAHEGWDQSTERTMEHDDTTSIQVTLDIHYPTIVEPTVISRENRIPAEGGELIFALSPQGSMNRYPVQLAYNLSGLTGDFNYTVVAGNLNGGWKDPNSTAGVEIQKTTGGNGTWYIKVRSSHEQLFSVRMEPIYSIMVGTPRVSCGGHGVYASVDITEDICSCVGYTGRFCDVRNSRSWLILLYLALGILGYIVIAFIWDYSKRKRITRQKNDDPGLDLKSGNRFLMDQVVGGALVTFENLCVPGRLHGVSGDFEPGTLSIILGGSGAGKSSLLGAIIGLVQVNSGNVFFNGHKRSLLERNVCDKVGLVPQFDELLEEFTVEENLRFSARIRVKRLVDLDSLVHETLRSLQLDHVRNSLVTEISGGQRRRVSIGIELVCQPSLLLLDEPTSGLDSDSALVVMQILHSLALKGQTVAAVIHQPSFEILTNVDHIIIVRKGRIAYNGYGLAPLRDDGDETGEAAARRLRDSLPAAWTNDRPLGASEMFEFLPPGANLADWLLSRASNMQDGAPAVEAENFGAEHRMARCNNMSLDVGPPQESTLPSPVWQFLVFTFQSLQKTTRRRAKLALMAGLVLIGGLVVGVIFKDQFYIGPVGPELAESCPQWLGDKICTLPQSDPIPNWAAVLCLGVGLTSLAPAVDVLLPEWTLVTKLRRSGVNVLAYYLSRMIADLPRIIISPVLFVAVFYLLLNPLMPFAKLYFIVLVTVFTSAGMGYLASVVVRGAPFLAGCVLTLISVAFSGTNPPLSVLNGMTIVNWLTNLSFARWAVESLYVAEVEENSAIYNVQSGIDNLEYGQSYLEPLKYLFLLGIAFRLLALLAYAVPFLSRILEPSVSKWTRSCRKKRV